MASREGENATSVPVPRRSAPGNAFPRARPGGAQRPVGSRGTMFAKLRESLDGFRTSFSDQAP
jgi:hypothetical protein